MRKQPPARESSAIARIRARFDRSLAITLFTGLVLLIVIGLVFSVAYGSKRITTDAESLHTADETLRAATVVRAQLALAVHASTVDLALGSDSSRAVTFSLGEAEEAIEDFEHGMLELRAHDRVTEPLRRSADSFFSTSGALAELVTANEVEAASELAAGSFGATFETLTADLEAVRNGLAESVRASDAALGRIGNIARFLVAFLLPAAVIFVYRELVRRQQRQIELENRLENERQLAAARETFIANASHELRTPLTSIIGLSVLLSEDPVIRQAPASAELIDVIISESDDLARMVEDLLTTARLDAGALHYVFDDIEVHAELADTVEVMQRAGNPIGLRCEPAVVRMDRLRFRQVVRNLLSNARKYGGPNLRVEGRIEGRTYVCAVVDDGPGIPEELQARLFERFIHQGHMTATKDSVGLGLSIVHALTQGMGGSISYERVNDETHFVVRMPLALVESGMPQGNGRRPTVLEGEDRSEPSLASEST